MSRFGWLLIAALSCAGAVSADSADSVAGAIARDAAHLFVVADAYLQVWWIPWEQAENGLRQPITGDEAADVASGFGIHRARVGVSFERSGLSARVSLRLEGSPVALSDAYLRLPVWGDRAILQIGQAKVPSTYEIATSSRRLDFLSRGRLSSEIVDLALVRSPSLSSPRFNGARARLRDLGAGLTGDLGSASYHFMVGNGLGANQYVGASEQKQEIYANEIGAHFYAARIEGHLLRRDDTGDDRYADRVDLGGHLSVNHHPNLVLDDKRTVLDVKRRSWSTDATVALLARLRLTGLFGGGVVGDDFDHDDKDDYRYRGWELKAVLKALDRLEVGLRLDEFTEEYYENGSENRHRSLACGLTWYPRESVRIQANYKHNTLKSDVNLDLDDDSLMLQIQVES